MKEESDKFKAQINILQEEKDKPSEAARKATKPNGRPERATPPKDKTDRISRPPVPAPPRIRTPGAAGGRTESSQVTKAQKAND